MSDVRAISCESLNNYKEFYLNNPMSKVATKAMSKATVEDVCYDTPNAAKMNHKFSIEIPTMPVCNQMSSGRCWLFSALNVLREEIKKKINVENIEISQNYISYFDKLEKANFFLETIIETSDKPADDRLVNWMLNAPVSDGGQWDMFVGLVKKYGLVPKEAMPETYQSSHTSSMNRIINSKLRKNAVELRKMAEDKKNEKDIRARKDEMLNEVYNILSICLGNPPKTFDFEYVDKDKAYHVDRNLTPMSFYEKYIGVNLDEFVSIINAPTETKPFNKVYTVDHLGSVIEAEPICYLNLEISEFKKIIVEQLKNNELVWFGCDTGKFGCGSEGIWDTAIYDYETPFGIDLEMSKGDMLDYGQSSMGHAMVITGVNLVDGKPDKWKIENSWGDGEGRGNKGYYIMSDEWFERYVYQACINKKYLSDEQKSILDEDRIVLAPWDPMGTLA